MDSSGEVMATVTDGDNPRRRRGDDLGANESESDLDRLIRLAREASDREAFVESILDHAPTGIAVYDTSNDFICQQHNAAFLRLVGSEHQAQGSIVGAPLDELYDTQSAAAVRAIYERVRDSGQALTIDEFPAVLASEPTVRYYRWSLTPLKTTRGSFLLNAAIEVTREVTARQQLERVAAESGMMAELTPGALARFAGQPLRLTFVNGAFHRLFPSAALGLTCEEAVDSSKLCRLLAEAYITKQQQSHDELQLENGATVALHVAHPPALAGPPEEMLVVIWDVSALAAARGRMSELAASLASRAGELEGLLQTLPSGVMVLDTAGNITRMNAACREMLAVGDIKTISDLMRVVQLLHPDGRTVTPNEYVYPAIMYSGDAREQTPRVVVLPDGARRDVLLTAAPLKGSGGVAHGAILVLHDVSELRRLERQKDDFLSAASHELKTPLTSLRGFAQTARRQARVLGDERIAHALDRISAQTHRMELLINDMLDITRIQAGQLDLNSQEEVVSDLIHHAIQDQRTALTQTIAFDDGLGAAKALVDKERLTQIVDNLLSNAGKYSPPQSIIRVTAYLAGARATITVSDEGVGIPPDELPHIFDRFYRARTSPVVNFGGMGLGLFISRTLAQRLGGELVAESGGENLGAAFHLTLPLLLEQVPATDFP